MTDNQAMAAVVLLNWNGWQDTIECLESLLASDYPDFRVVVCDNCSRDGSLERIQSWADGHVQARMSGPPWRNLEPGPIRKPVIWTRYTRAEAERGGNDERDAKLVLIDNEANLGFAGGNNVGLRYALARKEFAYFWLLNNDTVVARDALRRLVGRLESVPGAGMAGATLLYYHQPDRVQAWGGGRYDPRLGISSHLGILAPAEQKPDVAEVEREMAYVVGASLMVSRPFLENIGLMDERYFLYYEEIDWACRARGRYALTYAADSLVYHKEGGTVGSSHTGHASMLSMKFLYGNRLKFARRFCPRYLLRQWLRMGFECLVYLKRRQFAVAGIILAAMFGLLRLPIPSTR